jgi:DNA invertase Pin-like site-specific DNA recombinase
MTTLAHATLRAVLYPRVSSEEQRQKGTIGAQHFDLPAIVASKEWHLVKPANYYSDEGRSAKAGTLQDREGFLRLLADMQATPRPFDVVVVWDIDRLTRSGDIDERGQILGAFQRSGVLIYDAMKGRLIDLKTSDGDLIAVLGGWFASEDNRKRSDRTRSGQRRAIRENRKPNGRTPFGYVYSRDLGWAIDPVLGAVVIEIFVRVADGHSLAVIAEDLHRRGVRTSTVSDAAIQKRETKGKGRPKWTPARVMTIVSNLDLYAEGQWIANKAERTIVSVPPIVTHVQADAADRARASHGRRGKSRQKKNYLAQGLMRCQTCGANVAATYALSKGGLYLYYVCANRRRRPIGGAACTLPIMRADEVDARIWRSLVSALERPEYLAAAVEEQNASVEERSTWAKDLTDAEAKLAEFDRRVDRIASDYRAGRLPDSAWDAHMATVQRERAVRAQQVDAARAGVNLSDHRKIEAGAVLAAGACLSKRIKAADFATRREIVQALIPGRGKHVITLGPRGQLNVPLVFTSAPVSLPTFGSTACTTA